MSLTQYIGPAVITVEGGVDMAPDTTTPARTTVTALVTNRSGILISIARGFQIAQQRMVQRLAIRI